MMREIEFEVNYYKYLLGLLFFLPTLISAMEFKPAGISEHGCDSLPLGGICVTILASGGIEPGDAVALKKVIEKIEKSDKLSIQVGEIWLDSKGGHVRASMELGRYIRSRQQGTFVTHDSVCASACVLAYVGGVSRFAVGPMMIHSFYSKEFEGTGNFAQASKKYDDMAAEVEKYLKEMRITKNLLDQMMTIPHFQAKTLSFEEMEGLGLIGLDPVYAQTRKRKTR